MLLLLKKVYEFFTDFLMSHKVATEFNLSKMKEIKKEKAACGRMRSSTKAQSAPIGVPFVVWLILGLILLVILIVILNKIGVVQGGTWGRLRDILPFGS